MHQSSESRNSIPRCAVHLPASRSIDITDSSSEVDQLVIMAGSTLEELIFL